MSTHKCTVYGLTGAGSRLVIEVPDYIAPVACTPSVASQNSIIVETVIKTRKSSKDTRIKPVNGNRLVLGR